MSPADLSKLDFEKRLGSATTLYGTVALSFVIPSVPGFPTSPLLLATAYVVLPKENHMQLIEAATFDRKSGGAEGSAVPRTSLGNAEYHAQTEFHVFPRLSWPINRTNPILFGRTLLHENRNTLPDNKPRGEA